MFLESHPWLHQVEEMHLQTEELPMDQLTLLHLTGMQQGVVCSVGIIAWF